MKTTFFSLLALSLLAFLLISIGTAMSDSEHRSSSGDDDRWEHMKRLSTGVAANGSPLYAQECGSCHMAYPAGLLPVASWRSIMKNLSDHFGENAELDEALAQQVADFLIANAADNSDFRRSQQMMTAISTATGEPFMRITENPYFKREHDQIPARVIAQSGAASLSQCNACHQRAEQGSFNEHEIWIKGLGRYDD